MLTEFILSEKQEAEIARIDAAINELYTQRAMIYMMAATRVIPETEDEAAIIREKSWLQHTQYGQPLIKKEAVANIKFDETLIKKGVTDICRQ